MPSADPTPSLLSRLSPASPYPAVSRSSPGRELPPHLQHALDNDVRLGRSPPTSSSFPASPPKPSGLSSSPPKPSTSPRKANPNALRSPQPGSHLSSLPDDVLSRSAQPIPAARSTRSSRWAASPPTSPALGGTSSSPQAVFGSPASLRSSAAAPVGASPIAIQLGTSPGARSGLSPPKASASGALNQIESMLAQLRATPTSSPPKASTSVSKPSSSLPRHSPLVGASPHPPSVPAIAPAPASAPAPAPAPAAPSTSPKKKVLGGRSKWARADDDEPDEFASVEDKEQRQQGAPAGDQARARDEPAFPAPPVPAVAPAAATAIAHEPLPAPTPAPSSPPVAPPAPVPPPLEHRLSFAPSVATIRTETANAHLSWADDDDDELPDLDDWGISASSLPPPSFDGLDEPAPRQPPWSAAAPPPQQQQQSHPTLPPLGARRRSHSNASGGGGGGKHGHGHGHGHGSGRQARSPPSQHAQPPHHALRSPPTSPRVAAATTQPLKAPTRLFASAARAATAGAGAGAGAGARELPPHVIPHPAQAPSPAAAPPSTKSRERMAPSSALFSRLSGIGPSGAAGSGSGAGAGGVGASAGVGAASRGAPPVAGPGVGTGAGAASAGSKRRSKAGKPRASGAAGAVGAPPPSAPAPARFAPAPEGGSWRARGSAEGGAAASRWAQS